MTSDEFIKQQISAGHSIHLHRGVWWQRVAPFCYKPVARFIEIQPGKSNPKLLKSFLKYSHLVKNPDDANNYWPVMILNGDKLKNFSINSLSSSKRARVRKGLRLTEIKKIINIEPVVNDIKDVCISTALRTNHGLAPDYYIKKYTKWKAWITKEFSLPGREWWGAFNDGKLIAYMYSVLIDDTMYNYTAKSHTDFLDKCPNDALIFSFLEYCSSLDECRQVTFGDWNKDLQSLNRFKEKFGFEMIEFPRYAWFNPLTQIYLKFTAFIKS